MKKIRLMGFFLVVPSCLVVGRSIDIKNFTDLNQVVKADVANAGDTNKEVKAGERLSASVFGCQGVNDVRKVEVRNEFGTTTVKGGWSGCYSRQAYITPIIDSEGNTIGTDLEIR